MRKLATVQKIDNLESIEGADFIEKAVIKGWNVVVKKGEFQKGDLCVYFEIDSFLPLMPEFDFLLKSTSVKKMAYEGKEIEGIRLKTKKLKGIISQGLALPITSFKNILEEIGYDLSETLNIIKYEAPIPASLNGEVIGAMPGFIRMTDEERIQNMPEIFETNIGKSYYITEKVDGTSSSFFKYNAEFGVCGRNWQYKEAEGNTYWDVAKKYDLSNKIPEGFCVQGEILGEGIQKNKYKIKGQDLFVFYVYDINKSTYLPLEEMEAFVENMGLKTVPIIERDFILNISMPEILNMANGISKLSQTRREGLVFRLNGVNTKQSFKVISNEFLLKEEE